MNALKGCSLLLIKSEWHENVCVFQYVGIIEIAACWCACFIARYIDSDNFFQAIMSYIWGVGGYVQILLGSNFLNFFFFKCFGFSPLQVLGFDLF